MPSGRNVNAGLIDETALRYWSGIPKGLNHSAQHIRVNRAARDYPGNPVPEIFIKAESVESK
jgi:hypothetical protein